MCYGYDDGDALLIIMKSSLKRGERVIELVFVVVWAQAN